MLKLISKAKAFLDAEPYYKSPLMARQERIPVPTPLIDDTVDVIRRRGGLTYEEQDANQRWAGVTTHHRVFHPDPIRYEDQPLVPEPIRRVRATELKKGGMYRSCIGFQVRCLGRSPEGHPILLQYHRGDLTRELGVYMATEHTFPFDVIHETPEDPNAEQDF